jgi:citrate lyase subunit beta/citryl-CoA lyase
LLLLFQADPLRIRAINAPTMRSKLFVPGSRPELFAKALASSADAISIDLEDSVVENRKAEARATVRDFLLSPQARSTTKAIIVRVNALDTPHFEADVKAIVQPGLALLNVPKAESAANIHAAVAMLERVEAANGIITPLRVLANIETPKGLRFAAEIASAHSRVAGLQLGYVDLFGSMNIDRRDSASIHATLFAVRTAAGSAGVFAYDGAFGDVNDADGFKAEAQMAAPRRNRLCTAGHRSVPRGRSAWCGRVRARWQDDRSPGRPARRSHPRHQPPGAVVAAIATAIHDPQAKPPCTIRCPQPWISSVSQRMDFWS